MSLRAVAKQSPVTGDRFAAKSTPALAGGARESAARDDTDYYVIASDR